MSNALDFYFVGVVILISLFVCVTYKHTQLSVTHSHWHLMLLVIEYLSLHINLHVTQTEMRRSDSYKFTDFCCHNRTSVANIVPCRAVAETNDGCNAHNLATDSLTVIP